MTINISSIIRTILFIAFFFLCETLAEVCDGSLARCDPPYKCCGSMCCRDTHYKTTIYRWSIWNMWYFWFLVVFLLLTCCGGFGYYRRRQMMFGTHHPVFAHSETRGRGRATITMSIPSSFHHTGYANGGFATPYPAMPQQGAMVFPQPPAYTEVVSNPDLYQQKQEIPPPPPYSPTMQQAAPQAATLPVNETVTGSSTT